MFLTKKAKNAYRKPLKPIKVEHIFKEEKETITEISSIEENVNEEVTENIKEKKTKKKNNKE